jgi:hypothetical protein
MTNFEGDASVGKKSSALPWPTAIIEQSEPAVMHVRAARAGTGPQLWPVAPRWLHRYWDEMLSAHADSVRKSPSF